MKNDSHRVMYFSLLCGGVLFAAATAGLIVPGADIRAQATEAPPSPGSLALLSGRKTFAKRCSPCHGLTGLGDGPRATTLPVRPANLQKSRLTDLQKEYIIRLGGVGVGRAPFMPPWGQELSDTQIRNLILYLRAINVN